MRKGIIVLISALAISVMFMFLGDIDASGQAIKVRIGHTISQAALPLFVALDKGYFKELNIEVERINFNQPGPMLEALATGRIDIACGYNMVDGFLLEQRSGGKMKIFVLSKSPPGGGLCLIAREGSGIEKLQDFKGKRIGIPRGAVGVVCIRLLFSDFFDISTDVDLKPLHFRDMLEALKTGVIDGILVPEPIRTVVIKKKIGRVIVSEVFNKTILKDSYKGVSSFASSFIKRYPELALEIKSVFSKAIEDIRRNPEGASRLLPLYTHIPENIIGDIKMLSFFSADEADLHHLQLFAVRLKELGMIKKEIDAKQMLFK